MAIKSVKKTNIVDQIYDQMKENIMSGEWSAGMKIPSENELCNKFNVSRNSVRSSIQKLKALGVLKTYQGKGTFVTESIGENLVDSFFPIRYLSKEEMLDIIEFRSTIEKESVKLAAIRADQADIKLIEKALLDMKNNTDDYTKFSIADYQFHLNIIKASKNRIFYRSMIKLKDFLYSHLEEMNKKGDLKTSLLGHSRLFNAIKSGDYEFAQKISKDDMKKLKEEAQKYYD